MNHTSPSQLKKLFQEYNLTPLKQLGQNFLIDRQMVDKIVRFANVSSNDICLEIGPGAGALSVALCGTAQKLIAVEIDKGITNLLRDVLSPYHNAVVIHQDALKTDFSELLGRHTTDKVKVVANLPYYITSPLIFKLLAISGRISSMTLMVQKEVARRIAAKSGESDYSALSVLIQSRCDVDFGFKVPPDCFFPKPKVESAVIRLDILHKPNIDTDYAQFEKTVLMAFTQKRKTILNNIASQAGLPKETVIVALNQAGIVPTARAEQLDIGQFSSLTKALEALEKDLKKHQGEQAE